MPQAQIPLSEQGYMKVDPFAHWKGFQILKINTNISKDTILMYYTLFEMWNGWGHPRVITFTKENDIAHRKCIQANDTYNEGMKWMMEHGLIKNYVPGSRTGSQRYSRLEMVDLSNYYHENKNPYQFKKSQKAESEPEQEVDMSLLNTLPEDSPFRLFVEKTMTTAPASKPQAPTEPPKQEVKAPQISENTVFDAGMSLAEKAIEMYKAVHNIPAEKEIKTGLSTELEVETSIRIASYVAQKTGCITLADLNEKLQSQIGEKIGEGEDMLFVAALIEINFLKFAAQKHGIFDKNALKTAFLQSPETQQKSYLLMAGELMKQHNLSHWCDIYQIVAISNSVFYKAVNDPQLQAKYMNPYAISGFKWGKYAAETKPKTGKQMQGNKKKNLRGQGFEKE